jgi:hypothetical protein
MPPLAGRSYYAAAALLLACILALHILPFHPAVSYTIVFVLASALFLWVAYQTISSEIPARAVLILAAASLLVRMSFITATPIGSDDVSRYMWDGRVQAAGINPYLYAPSAPELDSLHTPLLPASVNHPDMKTIYFPLSQWVFYGCYRLSGDAIWGYKAVLLCSECVLFLALTLLIRKLSLPPKHLLLYALCPLPIMQFAVDAHLDGLGLPLLLFGMFLLTRGQSLTGLVLLGLSLSVKPVALLVLPIAFLTARGWRSRALTVLVPTVIFGVQFLPYIASSRPFEALSTFARHWTFNGVFFEALNSLLADNQQSRMVCAAVLAVVLLFIYLSRKDFFVRAYLAVLFLLLLSPVVHPWYVTWLAALLPIVPRWSGLSYVSTVSLTSFTVLTYTLTGSWEQYPIVLVAEYLPVLILLAIEFRPKSEEFPLKQI